jgi:hypothetical protein
MSAPIGTTVCSAIAAAEGGSNAPTLVASPDDSMASIGAFAPPTEGAISREELDDSEVQPLKPRRATRAKALTRSQMPSRRTTYDVRQ